MTLSEVAQTTVSADALVASVTDDDTAAVVTLCGEADLFTLPVVIDVLVRVIAESDGPVIVDLAQTEFIDTGTVRALARASWLLDGYGRTLTLRSPSKLAVRVFTLLGLCDLIEPGPNQAE
ncbi:MAG: STAS domain-containing protein [Actinobacteria bacterium]|nr:STAS domain-containing protein [Actinomycetota bacterium]